MGAIGIHMPMYRSVKMTHACTCTQILIYPGLPAVGYAWTNRLPCEHVPHIQPSLQSEHLKQGDHCYWCVVETEVSTMGIPGVARKGERERGMSMEEKGKEMEEAISEDYPLLLY